MKRRRTPPGYASTLRYLYGLQYRGIKVGLKNIRALAASVGHPERSFPAFHIAGTNGKGSTSSFLASILTESGYRTGLYTSPHLVDFTERIRIDGVPIPERTLVAYTRKLRPMIEKTGATFFEATTCIAYQYFADQGVDAAVIETGLGGRLDATNILTPLVSIITNVGLDHQEILGNTIRKIAREKAGIIKRGTPVVTGAEGEALEVITRTARRLGTPLHVQGGGTAGRAKTPLHAEGGEIVGVSSKRAQVQDGGTTLRLDASLQVQTAGTSRRSGAPPHAQGGGMAGGLPLLKGGDTADRMGIGPIVPGAIMPGRLEIPPGLAGGGAAPSGVHVKPGLPGRHQVVNARLALTALSLVHARGLFTRVNPASIRRGLRRVTRNTGLRGRMELVRGAAADCIIDVGHNPAGIRTVVREFRAKHMRFAAAVFGAMRDKDTLGMLDELRACADRVIVVRPRTPRAETVASLLRKAKQLGMEAEAGGTVEKGIRRAVRIVTGITDSRGEARSTPHPPAGRVDASGSRPARQPAAVMSPATVRPRPRILIIGSHYVAGEALSALEKIP